MKFTITKIKGAYRIRFAGAPFYNTNRATRHEAEQYASRVLAGIAASERNPISWP